MVKQIDINTIDESGVEDKITQFVDGVKDGKHIFLFLFMDGCGPCNSTKEKWKNILGENGTLDKKYIDNDDIIVAKINKDLFEKLGNIGHSPSGFPSLRYIKNNGTGKNNPLVEEYENSGIKPLDRSGESFAAWIDSKMKGSKNKKASRGGSKKSKKSKKSKRSKKSRKTMKTRKTRKTKKNRKRY